MDPELLKELRGELKKAAEPIAQDARRRVKRSIKNRSRSTGRAAASIRITAGGNRIRIVGGKKRVPYYGWLDFGGTLHPSGGRRNLQTRPIIRRGRYIYPAIDAGLPDVVRRVDRVVNDTARKVFK